MPKKLNLSCSKPTYKFIPYQSNPYVQEQLVKIRDHKRSAFARNKKYLCPLAYAFMIEGVPVIPFLRLSLLSQLLIEE